MSELMQPSVLSAHTRADDPAVACRLLMEDLKPLHRLAHLLTGDRERAEASLVEAVAAFDSGPAAGEPVRDWVKQTVVRCAAGHALGGRDSGGKAGWSLGQTGEYPHRLAEDAPVAALAEVSRLPALERAVFVLTLLEDYSRAQCAALLGLRLESVSSLQTMALRRLSSARRAGLAPAAPLTPAVLLAAPALEDGQRVC